MNSILCEIIAKKKDGLIGIKKSVPIGHVQEIAAQRTDYRNFRQAVSHRGTINIIAEIKKASPSAGEFQPYFDAALLAKGYADNGACAISVLTEEHYFHGSLAHLAIVRRAASVPVLRKDFIVDVYQIYESAAAGADAILLIAAALEKTELQEYCEIAATMKLDCLVEVHNEDELSRAISCTAPIVGINNRDLNSFTVDLETTARLLPMIPASTAVVMESGIKTKQEIERFKGLGVSAFLVGETLLRSPNPAITLRSLNS